MRCCPKGPEIGLPKINHFSKFLFTPISFKVVPFSINTVILAGFPRLEALLEVILHQHLYDILQFGLDLFSSLKASPLELQFHSRK
jgi:hypothetical protein